MNRCTEQVVQGQLYNNNFWFQFEGFMLFSLFHRPHLSNKYSIYVVITQYQKKHVIF